MRIGILGGGNIARKAYLPLLSSWPEIELAGMLTQTEASWQEGCAQWHIPFGTTRLEALLDQDIQAAFILTQNDSHFDYASRLLQAGVDVFVEKPPAQDSLQVQSLANCAREGGRILMVGFNRRFAPLYRQAKEILAGHPISLCVLEKHRPNATHVSLYNNYIDDTIHQIDLLRYYCGEVQVQFTTSNLDTGKLVNALSLCHIPGGGIGVVQTSLQASAWQEKAAIHGDGLSLEIEAFHHLKVKYPDRDVVYGNDRPGRWIPDLVERGFYGTLEHFFQCVNSRAEPETNGCEAAKTQQLLEAMVELNL